LFFKWDHRKKQFNKVNLIAANPNPPHARKVWGAVLFKITVNNRNKNLNNMKTWKRFKGFAIGMATLGLLCAAVNGASIYTDGAAPYTVFGLSNVTVNLSNTKIYGNVGVGPGADLKLMAPTTVYGNIYLDATATESASAGTYTGTKYTGLNLVPAVQYVLLLSSTSAGMTPTATYGAVNSDLTINGNGGVNVIDISSIDLNNFNLTLNGGVNDLFYINVASSVTLTGTASIIETGGAGPLNVLLNVLGTGTSVSTHVGDQINGIILDPQGSVNLDGTFNGQIIAGGVQLGLLSGAVVNSVPEPTTAGCFLLGLGALACFQRFTQNRRS
jgi:hypothetical protein